MLFPFENFRDGLGVFLPFVVLDKGLVVRAVDFARVAVVLGGP